MSRRGIRRGRLIPVLFFTFVAGIASGWLARAKLTDDVEVRTADVPLSESTSGDVTLTPPPTDRLPVPIVAARPEPASGGDPVAILSRKDLRLPVDGASVSAMKGQFGESRERGARGHEAVDILAPRNTPVHAVENGTIAKLFLSKQGGITIYQFDPDRQFCYYYAHLERYVPGLHEGQAISRGDVIGFVGTTGNAPPNTPHLHFAIFELTPEKHWWQGTPLDPWAAFNH